MRKPVLEWEYAEDFGIHFLSLPIVDSKFHFNIMQVRENQWNAVPFPAGVRTFYPTADEAKLACEDHLATLLEPLAKTYDILKENKK